MRRDEAADGWNTMVGMMQERTLRDGIKSGRPEIKARGGKRRGVGGAEPPGGDDLEGASARKQQLRERAGRVGSRKAGDPRGGRSHSRERIECCGAGESRACRRSENVTYSTRRRRRSDDDARR